MATVCMAKDTVMTTVKNCTSQSSQVYISSTTIETSSSPSVRSFILFILLTMYHNLFIVPGVSIRMTQEKGEKGKPSPTPNKLLP